jgi:AraC-like DNA-binding protein
MGRLTSVSVVRIDRERGARQYDYHLSPQAPLYASENHYPQPTALEVDVHEGMEVGVVLEGEQERTHEGLVRLLRPGDAWLSAGWEQHGWRTTVPETRDVVLLFLPEFLGVEQVGELSWLAIFALPPEGRPTVQTEKTRAWVLQLGSEMVRELEEERPGWQGAVRLDVLRLLLEISREWHPAEGSGERPLQRASDLPRMLPALALVHARPGRRVVIAEAAKACRLGRARFCAVFRNTMGMTFGQFCLKSRLTHAARLLLSENLPIGAIADRTGFADSSHLHRAFTKQHGCTPGVYRARTQRPRVDT